MPRHRHRSVCRRAEVTPADLIIRQRQELAHHAVIDRALERHHEIGNVLQRLPTPGGELRAVGAAVGFLDVDFAFRAGEAKREPFLLLPAIFALPGLADEIAGMS